MTEERTEWITPHIAARMLGVTRQTILSRYCHPKPGERPRITFRIVPGLKPRYLILRASIYQLIEDQIVK